MAELQHADGTDEFVIGWRRRFHAYPEPGFREFATASAVAVELRTLGWDVLLGDDAMDRGAILRPPADDVDEWRQAALRSGADASLIELMSGGATAVVATRRFGEGPTIGFRFDMDALPIMESQDDGHRPTTAGFASRNPGWMHACGHDGHTAIGLGLARALALRDTPLGGAVRLLFQPAEEGAPGGARAIAARGHVDDLDALTCIHLGLDANETGAIACSATFLATSKYRITFRGRGSHVVLAPHEGRNALLAAASAALALHAIAPHPRGWFSLNVGTLHAGVEQGVTPPMAELEVGLWAESQEAQDHVRSRLLEVVDGVARMWGVEVELTHIGEAPPADQSSELAEAVAAAARDVPGVTTITRHAACRAGEDANVLLARAAERGGLGTYILIGTRLSSGHHTPTFDIDESSLGLGVRVLERLCERLCPLDPLDPLAP